ncbi:ribosome small subunit-dependent GTPase A [Desulfatirhabdium butyrativorans]|uniref:ribosome small subunit-dependent GTPase A n=1 Tax=Desulfatirhabdium butyrativorans TaxID=340467 RepID=UPI0004298B14|nr:ribosome small subunit-dependent GTPase A [Desulfatirhabdium butyrativorans]
MELRELGFDQWFEAQSNELWQEGCGFARISAVDRGSYLINNGDREVPAELTGKLSYQIESSVDLPCVGDWVTAQYFNDDTAAIIHRVFHRKTFLRRKTAGENIDFQMIAANIDTAFIVQSCHFDFNPHRLHRYIVMATDGHVEPVVILTKTDLISSYELGQKIAIIGSVTKARVLALSNITGIGFDELRQTLLPGRTYCLLGSSGVGKTTIINRLMGFEVFDTKAVSGTGEGTHTTSRRQLIALSQGAMLVDTPGMRELGLVGAGDGIDTGFEEFGGLSANCRYANCSHENEPGCAVLDAIEKGELSKERYDCYIKLKKESEYHEMSYLDKRKKDKAFGRFIKSAKKKLKD